MADRRCAPADRLPTRRSVAVLVLALVAVLFGGPTLGPKANASATTRTWLARVGNLGSLGSNGTATLVPYWTGGGRLELHLRRLAPSVSYPLVLYRGPRVSVGTSWSARGRPCTAISDGPLVSLRAIRSSRDGTVTLVLGLSTAQVARLVRYPRTLAIMVGAGSAARCGGFAPQTASLPAPQPVATATPGTSGSPGANASPSASPPPGASPAPVASAACDPWPAAIDEVLAVLSTPADLCLKIFRDASAAPAFLRAVRGLYVPAFLPGDRPTVYYPVGATEGTEFFVLAHEVCHAHQDRVAGDAGRSPLEGWYLTAPGADFIQSTGWLLNGGRWVAQGAYASPIEDNADACAIWFDQTRGPRFLRRWAPSRFGWAQRWLPLPSWITPWQPVDPSKVVDRRAG